MIIRYDPLRDFDRLSRQVWRNPASSLISPSLPLDVYRYTDRVEAVFDIPGVDPESIDITVEKDTLTVQAQRSRITPEGEEALVNERFQGTFSRRLSLGQSLDSEKVSASYLNGVLTVTVPIAEQAKARKIEVTSGTTAAPITVESTQAA